MIRFISRLRSVALLLALVVVPPAFGIGAHPADARPGGGYSIGSRGSRTFSAPPATAINPGGALPFNRSLSPRQSPYYGNNGGYGTVARSHPFATGLVGGLVGAGLGGLLFGHGFFGGPYGGGGGGAGILGLLIQLAILFFVGRWLWRRFARGGVSRPMAGGPSALGGPGRTATAGASPVTASDYKQFEQALLDIQQAWSMQDLRALGRFATPEMVSYFSEQLSDLSSRNLRNVVSAVRMEQGDLSEAWSENNRDFATVAMRYSMVDVTTDLTGRVVDGSPNERQVATELWTFVRARAGGSWLLSAIQQSR